MQSTLNIFPVTDLPLIHEGDDLASIVVDALRTQNLGLKTGDIVVVAQKVVSKAEGRLVKLDEVTPGKQACELALEVDKDPRLVELILQESSAVIRKTKGILIVKHRLGIICANAGIDKSNIDHSNGDQALLLPRDPDLSARKLQQTLAKKLSFKPGVIISDSLNRPWRLGTIGHAIGSAGIMVLDDRCGDTDIYDRKMNATIINRADSIAAAAVLMMGETSERIPVALVRGLPVENSRQIARDAVRQAHRDLFL